MSLIEARGQNFEQLAGYIAQHSRSQAVIVAGDTNLRASHPRSDAQTLAAFIERVGLSDACQLAVTPDEQIDRLLTALRPSSSSASLVAGTISSSLTLVAKVSLSWRRVQPEQLVAQRAER